MHYYTPPRHPITQFNSACIAFVTNLSVAYNATVYWVGNADPGVIWYQMGKDVFCNFTAVGQTADFSVSVTNSCGTSYESYNFKCTTSSVCCGLIPLSVGGGVIKLSPNPVSNSMVVSLEDKSKTAQKAITEIRIVDKMGNIKQTSKYADAIKRTSLNISLLKSDVYTIQVFDGQTWYSEKFIKN